MKTHIIKRYEGKFHVYTLRPISDIEARMLGLDRVGQEKAETRNKTKKS